MEWLPALIPYDTEPDWQPYEDLLFSHFCNDFVSNCPVIGRRRLGIESKPEVNGKHRTFWHLISEGMPEPLRTICHSRCARIRWPRAMILAIAEGKVRTWRNVRGTRNNFLIALEDFSYLVVLVVRKGFYYLWTAHCVEYPSHRVKLQREHDEYQVRRKSESENGQGR